MPQKFSSLRRIPDGFLLLDIFSQTSGRYLLWIFHRLTCTNSQGDYLMEETRPESNCQGTESRDQTDRIKLSGPTLAKIPFLPNSSDRGTHKLHYFVSIPNRFCPRIHKDNKTACCDNILTKVRRRDLMLMFRRIKQNYTDEYFFRVLFQ